MALRIDQIRIFGFLIQRLSAGRGPSWGRGTNSTCRGVEPLGSDAVSVREGKNQGFGIEEQEEEKSSEKGARDVSDGAVGHTERRPTDAM